VLEKTVEVDDLETVPCKLSKLAVQQILLAVVIVESWLCLLWQAILLLFFRKKKLVR